MSNPRPGTLALAALLAAAPIALADVITFDALGPSTIGTIMPGQYAGLRWGNGGTSWHYMTLAGNPSDTFLALSGNSTFVGGIGGADFNLNSVDIWSRRGLDANGDFYFVLYHDGATVYNGVIENDGRQRFTGAHTTFVPSYTGPIDGFAFAFDSNGLDWNHLAMDNVNITFVPAPGALALGLTGALSLTRRRR